MIRRQALMSQVRDGENGSFELLFDHAQLQIGTTNILLQSPNDVIDSENTIHPAVVSSAQ
ncbi:hypothetical protein A6779_04540 [Marinobacter adhaerens]|jgi:hypothetical protein|uniref:Uncharacterized protein n=1 Tax=Marinobacter salsuginis TaxID=418719 RepID=A0A5M3PUR4_9GAMM|nr:hypothetical protein A6779_04540 [Marinobacter adhaerens]GBO84602.1 hypothetical protein MS5N3_20530 [Marinobacter salsuginis]GBO86588.1 hypothetical protein MSSD14B_02560 [Marinobacter salsuginis]|tara:strand:+ start:2413 stop:2592 length:180 start_codon:yes stop_codon:yes gene_type:complete